VQPRLLYELVLFGFGCHCLDPCRTGERVVGIPVDDGGVAVSGQRDGVALLRGPNRAVPTSFGPCCVNCASASCDERSGVAAARTDALNISRAVTRLDATIASPSARERQG
jgi:hypothetical protein